MRFTLIALLVSLILLSACGQKGPLYLPQDTAAKPPAPATDTTDKQKPNADAANTNN